MLFHGSILNDFCSNTEWKYILKREHNKIVTSFQANSRQTYPMLVVHPATNRGLKNS